MSNQLVDGGKRFRELTVTLPLPTSGTIYAPQDRVQAMPIIALILSTLVFWLLYWFIRMGGLDHLRERSTQRKEEARRQAAREAARLAPLRAIDDPRDAAAILMLLVARADGDPTREQIAAVENILRSIFGFERELTERMTQARFIAKQTDSFEQAAAVFAGLFKQRLTSDERQQLVDMLEEVARHEGPTEIQMQAISAFRPMIGLVPAT
jgi:uncharacterized tellurite resistance protein B-like protein